jgi:large subunit ribosomal protein L18
MIRAHNARALRMKRKRRIRSVVSGTPTRQRLSVFRSGKHIYAQVIDDTEGHTVAAASSLEVALRGGPPPADTGDGEASDAAGRKVRVATAVGHLVGERALAAGVTKVAFDRGGFMYHGRIKALADGARAAGLDF